MMADDEFSSLKPSVRRAIDVVFMKLAKQSSAGETKAKQLARKKRRVGGSDDEGGGGGFVRDEDEAEDDEASDDDQDPTIPLSLIPTGLQMLDLAPDDQEVLAVFRNAATGWENPRPRTARQEPEEDGGEAVMDKDAGLSVSKDDWRAVCAVLLGQAQEEDQDEPEASNTSRRSRRKPSPAEARPATGERRQARDKGKTKAQDPDSDEGGGFMLEEEEDQDDAGGFEWNEEEEDAGSSDSDRYSESASGDSASEFGAPSNRPRTTRAAAAKTMGEDEDDSEVESDDTPLTLTARQEREARVAFALFFPGVDANDPGLHTKKIGIREVGDAAKALKEKLSTDDVSLVGATEMNVRPIITTDWVADY
ncbi:hypothetical protein FS749_002015 [Ceratobasidium sp. UAMH 11750]|nr:hypothetical protein FS749_002015 [Ceratobasidium sp. UAMH 11750]